MTSNKTRNVNKRKLDAEIQEKDKKAKKKVSSTDKFKDLQEKYDLLLDENKKNLELI